jgi:hypothetical protein
MGGFYCIEGVKDMLMGNMVCGSRWLHRYLHTSLSQLLHHAFGREVGKVSKR